MDARSVEVADGIIEGCPFHYIGPGCQLRDAIAAALTARAEEAKRAENAACAKVAYEMPGRAATSIAAAIRARLSPEKETT